MNRLERIYDPEETLRVVMDSRQARIWTALPGIINSFDESKNTCSIRPAITGRFRAEDGTWYEVKDKYLLLDCPVVWQGGGGCTLTFPIKEGDECLVVFASRCIDAWWQEGGVQPQLEYRMHSLSDGFALVGVRSQPRKFDVSATAAQLRTDDGAAYIQLNPDTHEIDVVTDGNVSVQSGGDVTATATGAVSITAPTITLNGSIVLNGPISQSNASGLGTTASIIGPVNVTNDVTAGGKSVEHHTHPGDSGGTTGQPN